MPAIIGTAGHIDHGKTALIRALTGQETDRLKEEQERGISIDLGFAYFERPDGGRAGIVDVPGHERFIRNMLAGAHGIDLVLLVVAADDGVMPQTEEHLEILHLLGVRCGIAVITKTDLVAAGRVDEVRDEIAVLLDGTALAGMGVVPVSARTGAGLDRLRGEIERQLAALRRSLPGGRFRMPVDRAFVMKGHGVVATGTAVAGVVREGDAVRLLPGGDECRVRTLQVHGERVAEAVSGQRVALNLSGVERADVGRGDAVVHAEITRTTDRFDAVVEIRPLAKRPVKTHARVRVYLGTAEVTGKLVLLDERAVLAPRESGYGQVALDDAVLALYGDRFILRDETAHRTLGGGVVLLPFATQRRRRNRSLEALQALRDATSANEAMAALVRARAHQATPLEWLGQAMGLGRDEVVTGLRGLPGLALLPDAASPEAVATIAAIEAFEDAVLRRLDEFHRAAPLAPGVEVESLRAQAVPALPPKLFRSVLDALERRGALVRRESLVRRASHAVALGGADRELGDRAEQLLAAEGFTPPDLKQLEARLAVPRKRLVEILAQVEREGRVVRVGPELYFAREPLDRARQLLVDALERHGEISAAAFRDLIDASRKFSIALLDYFDRTGVTLRVGDIRRLRGG